MYWQDVDLRAWQSLKYQPMNQYQHMPISINRPDSAFDLNNAIYNVVSIGDLSVFRVFDDVLFPLTDRKRFLTQAVDRADDRGRRSRHKWVSEGATAVNVPELSVGDYSATSLGNLRRANGVIDWFQQRGKELDRKLAGPIGRTQLPTTRVVHKTIDTAQDGFWEVYRFAQRVVIEVLDEMILNGIENGTDRAINGFRRLPAEVIVDGSGSIVETTK